LLKIKQQEVSVNSWEQATSVMTITEWAF